MHRLLYHGFCQEKKQIVHYLCEITQQQTAMLIYLYRQSSGMKLQMFFGLQLKESE